MKFSIKNFFTKFDQIGRKLRIRSILLKKSSMENFVFSAVVIPTFSPHAEHKDQIKLSLIL